MRRRAGARGICAAGARPDVRGGVRDNELAQQLRAGHVLFTGGSVKVSADDPAKVERPDEDTSKNLMPQLMPEFAGCASRC